jgi:hypothetical protein
MSEVGNVYMTVRDGQPVITRADPRVSFSLELFDESGRGIGIKGGEITLMGLVTYRVTGYHDGSLIAELVEDRRDNNRDKEGEQP